MGVGLWGLVEFAKGWTKEKFSFWINYSLIDASRRADKWDRICYSLARNLKKVILTCIKVSGWVRQPAENCAQLFFCCATFNQHVRSCCSFSSLSRVECAIICRYNLKTGKWPMQKADPNPKSTITRTRGLKKTYFLDPS
jgi:hypothetical protein